MADAGRSPIGILGGTFDPIHYGHLRPALEALEALGLSEVRFIPCRQPAHRNQPLATAQQRLALVERAVAGQPRFIVDDRELRRPGPSYTVDTLISLRSQFGKQTPLCLLLGSDAISGLAYWHRYQELSSLAHLVVLHRPGIDAPCAEDLNTGFGWRTLEHLEDLHNQAAGGVWFQPVTQLAISATQIRELLAAGKSPRYLLPDSVLDYIFDQGLYRSTLYSS